MSDIVKIKIPAAGTTAFKLITGRSIVIAESSDYSSLDQSPKLFFESTSSSNGLPVIPQNVYFHAPGKFSRLVVKGTSESAGDEISLLVTDECLPTRYSNNAFQISRPTLKATFKETASDEVKELTEFQLVNDNLALPSAMYVTAIDSKVHFAFDIDPEQGAGALGHVILENETVKIIGLNFIKGFRYINAINATDATVNFTLEY